MELRGKLVLDVDLDVSRERSASMRKGEIDFGWAVQALRSSQVA